MGSYYLQGVFEGEYDKQIVKDYVLEPGILFYGVILCDGDITCCIRGVYEGSLIDGKFDGTYYPVGVKAIETNEFAILNASSEPLSKQEEEMLAILEGTCSNEYLKVGRDTESLKMLEKQFEGYKQRKFRSLVTEDTLKEQEKKKQMLETFENKINNFHKIPIS